MSSSIILQFSSSTAWQSSVIRRLCHSPFSHVDIVIPYEGLLGASGPDSKLHDIGGVRIRPFQPWPYSIRRRCTIQTDKADAIVAAARSQIGKPFDNGALYAFLSNPSKITRDWRQPDKWFCSELVTWAFEKSGFFSYPIVPVLNRVCPSDLLLLLNPWIDVEKFWNPVPGLTLGPKEQ